MYRIGAPRTAEDQLLLSEATALLTQVMTELIIIILQVILIPLEKTLTPNQVLIMDTVRAV